MIKTNSDSNDESEVRKELSELKDAYEHLLNDSKTLITHYSKLKKKNKELNL